MTFELWFTMLSGVPLAALGLWVGSLGSRDAVNRAFALFAVAFGLRPIGNYLAQSVLPSGSPWADPLLLFAILCHVVASGALVWLAWVFPAALKPRDRAAWIAGLVAGGLVLALHVAGTARDMPVTSLASAHSPFLRLTVSAFFVPLVVFVLRWRHAPEVERVRLTLMSSALVVYIGAVAGGGSSYFYTVPSLLTAGFVATAIASASVYVVLMSVALLWLIHAGRGGGRGARNVAWLALLIPPLAGVAAILSQNNVYLGVARVATVLVLAYAVLRHQLLGVDVKLRFAISKSTIAAVFIAVFFIASEAAQQFFGERLNSTYIGIGIAGTLVFAMAPLQRVAEKLAEKAVPVTTVANAARENSKENAYRRALRIALRDRKLTPDEEIHLHEVAEHMGIGAGRAMALRIEIERETRKAAIGSG